MSNVGSCQYLSLVAQYAIVFTMTLNWSQETYTKTYRFAAEAHHRQLFPGTELPYIMHVSFVCMEVTAALAYEPEQDGHLAVQCALLHDVIEDSPHTGDSLQDAGFEPLIVTSAEALSKNPGEDYMKYIERTEKRALASLTPISFGKIE